MAHSVTELSIPQKERRRALVVPREHGAWGMLLIPLLTGAAVGWLAGGRVIPVLLLTAATLALFWLRTPVESRLGTSAVRVQTPYERQLVDSVILPLALLAGTSLSALLWNGRNRQLVWIGIIAGVAFAVQVLLKKMGRATRMVAEIVGALALTATAPAAYCVATGRLDARAWMLWLLNWLFAGNQVHYVWVRIRGSRAAGLREKFTVGWSLLAGQVVLGSVLVIANAFRWPLGLPMVAFIPMLFRGFVWFVKRPEPIVVRQLGWTELAHAVVFAVLLTAGFGLEVR